MSTSEDNAISNDNSSNHNIDSINSRAIEYNPEIMWFDYQSLFEQVRKNMLKNLCGTDCASPTTVPVRFNKTNVLEKVLIKSESNNDHFINKVIQGDYKAVREMMENLLDYMNDNEENLADGEYYILEYNYRCLLAVVAHFSRSGEYDNAYLSIAKKFPIYFGINYYDKCDVKFYDIAYPLLNKKIVKK